MIKIPIRRRKVKGIYEPFTTWLALGIDREPIEDVFCILSISVWRWGIEVAILDTGLSCYIFQDYDREYH